MPRKKSFTNRSKINILEELDERRGNGESLRAIAAFFGVQPNQLRKWVAAREHLEVSKLTARSLCRGPNGDLQVIEEDLLRWFFELREQGFGVSRKMVVLKAMEMHEAFCLKTEAAKYMCVRRFLCRHYIGIRCSTHQSQRCISEIREQLVVFVRAARRVLVNRNREKEWIINMDQTPVWFTMTPKRTLEKRGGKTVHVRSSTSRTVRATVAVTVTAGGTMLPPVLIFKGKPGGRIQKGEFKTYPSEGFYACQKCAWMDEDVMHTWIEKVLAPYVKGAPPNVRPVILLDSYRCHIMSSIVDLIVGLGVHVKTIPGGCTPLCQPMDVGIGKPLKSRCRDLWDQWMIDQGIERAVCTPPSRKTMAEWVIATVQSFSRQTIMNSWMHDDYRYFDS